MTKRERVAASLEHRQPDIIPYHLSFTYPAHRAMAEYLGDPHFDRHIGNHLAAFTTVIPDRWQEVCGNVWADEFGVEWDKTVDKDIGVVRNRMVDAETIDALVFPDPADPARWAPYAEVLAQKEDYFYIADLGFSLFERAWTLYGMEALFTDMMARPDVVHRLLDRILEFNLAIVEKACSHDIDAMIFGDDWGSQQGLLTGLPLWREFILPRVRQMYGAVHRRGKKVFIHSCGKVDELFPLLIEAGVDCFNPFQPEVMDVYAVKERYGDRLSFYGGISTQKTLTHGTPEDVREEVKRLLEHIGRDGGYICAPAHGITGDTPPRNMEAMIEVLHNQ